MLAIFFFHQTFFLYFSLVELKHDQVTRANVPLRKHPQRYCAKGDL